MNKSNSALGLKSLKVNYAGLRVGILAMTPNGRVAFSYDEDWVKSGFSVSPFSLPCTNKVFVPQKLHFDGLFGIFADSLPDAWGRLLLERTLKLHGLEDNITVLDRLALVGKNGMGALEYEPDYEILSKRNSDNLDFLATECKKVLQSETCTDLDLLYSMAGSSGGARPKVLLDYNGKHWLVKFPAHVDMPDIGLQEYQYSLCAKKCGIDMPETLLFPSERCKGYFATLRFDRTHEQAGSSSSSGRESAKVHMATAAALLEADFRTPCLDYHDLMKLTKILTRDNTEDVENMYRRMCFNVFAHNRDDHAKNFTFLYCDDTASWRLSPAYDLTFSNTYFGEHTTSIDGNGKNPTDKDLLNVGLRAGMSKSRCCEIIEQIRTIVSSELAEWL